MRRRDREITDRAELEEILGKATVLYLGLVDQGEPYVVPVNFAYADGNLYLHSASEGRKVALLKRNPRVCFAVHTDHEVLPGALGCEWNARFRSVIGHGRASFLESREEKLKALDALLGRFAPGPFRYNEEVLSRTAVIRIEVERLTGKKKV